MHSTNAISTVMRLSAPPWCREHTCWWLNIPRGSASSAIPILLHCYLRRDKTETSTIRPWLCRPTFRRPAAGTFICFGVLSPTAAHLGRAAQTRTGHIGCRRSACLLVKRDRIILSGEYDPIRLVTKHTGSSIDNKSRESIFRGLRSSPPSQSYKSQASEYHATAALCNYSYVDSTSLLVLISFTDHVVFSFTMSLATFPGSLWCRN